MLQNEEYQARAAHTLDALYLLIPQLHAAAERDDAIAALQLYTSVRVLVDDLQQIAARDKDRAGYATVPTGTANEYTSRLLGACRGLARLEDLGHPTSHYVAQAIEAVQALRSSHAFDVR